MSYVALATDNYDDVVSFYGTRLGFPVVEEWDRDNGRGVRFDLDGMRLEILDNNRQRNPLFIPEAGDRFHVVVEVDDIKSTHARLALQAPEPQHSSWGAILFQVRDPDGVPVTFLQWTNRSPPPTQRITGRVSTGEGRGREFTALTWVRQQLIEKLDIDPYPGTLNLTLDHSKEQLQWENLKRHEGICISNSDPEENHCEARCFPVTIEENNRAVIILPDVPDYPKNKVEIIAEIPLRGTFNLRDNVEFTLEYCSSPLPAVTASNLREVT